MAQSIITVIASEAKQSLNWVNSDKLTANIGMKMNIKEVNIKSLWEWGKDVLLLLPFFVVLCTVFVVDRSLALEVVAGKYFWFAASLGLTVSVLFFWGLFQKTNLPFSKSDASVGLFLLVVGVSSFLLNGDRLNITKLALLFLLVIFYVSCRMVLNPRRKYLLCLFLIITGLVEAIWGLRQLYGFERSQHSLFKLTGSFYNPGPYMGYLAVITPLALHLFLNEAKSKIQTYLQKGLGGTTLVAVLLVLPAGMSRASWLAVLLGCSIVAGSYYARKHDWQSFYNKYKQKIRLFGLLGLSLFFLFLIGIYFMKKDSADGRLLMWKVSGQVIKSNPWGVGIGNFSGAYGDAQAAYFANGEASATEEYVAGNPEYAFNEYLQIIIESGIIAFLLFITMLVLAFRNGFKQKESGIVGSLAAFLVFAAFSYPFSILPSGIVFVCLLAATSPPSPLPKREGELLTRDFRSIAILTACLSFTVYINIHAYPYYQAYKTWNKNRIYYHASMYKDVAKEYEKIYPYLKDQVGFLFEYAQSLSKSQQYGKSNEVLSRAIQISCDPMLYNIMGKNHQSKREYKEAESAFLKATHIVPNRLYPHYLLAKLYMETGEKEKAIHTAEIVLTKEPKVMSRAVEEMREEMRELGIGAKRNNNP